MQPYYDLVHDYGWGNYFFQTNQGNSWPGHQFLFGMTSASTAAEDAAGNFIGDAGQPVGCTTSQLDGVVGPSGNYIGRASTCLQHDALSHLLEAKRISWKYYGVNGYWPDSNATGIWMAPNSIASICGASGGQCKGADWMAHVTFTPSQVLKDINGCTLPGVSWVIPDGTASDHIGHGGAPNGPAWVASIVNAVGQSSCGYWDSTAIVVTWDDWGGFYDHELPPIEAYPQGGYQMGFRVPIIVVSAYTPKGHISNKHEDFGSIGRFIENNFGTQRLGFADARGTGNLSEYFTLSSPRTFKPIVTTLKAEDFIRMPLSNVPPDDD
jgi:phospholipase C